MLHGETQRRAVLAVLISLALHLLLVLWLRGVSIATAPPPAPRVLTAQLAQPAEAPAAPAATPVVEPEPPREKPRLSRKTPAARLPADKPPPAHETPAPAESLPATPSGGIDLADALDAAPIAQAEVFDPALIGRYRAALIMQMNQRRFYPLPARARNQTGKVEMRVDFARGELQDIVVIHSSGYTALDEGAIQLVRAAYRETLMPPPLKARSFSLERVQVDYGLELKD